MRAIETYVKKRRENRETSSQKKHFVDKRLSKVLILGLTLQVSRAELKKIRKEELLWSHSTFACRSFSRSSALLASALPQSPISA